IKTKTIDLEEKNAGKLQQWTTHGLNLRDIINPEPGAIYRVRFSFNQSYTFTECENASNASYYSEYYDYYENSTYENREENTCNRYFYYYSTKSKNLLASDLGLVVKNGDNGTYTIASTNLISGAPQPNATVKFYNYAQKLLKTVRTDEQGIANVRVSDNPSVVIASYGKNKAYLKLNANASNSLSKFETQGVRRSNGVDAFFYGERGVWRPGDSIYLSCVIRDEQNKMRNGIPMKMKFTNPSGQVVSTQTLELNKIGIQSIKLKTEADAPTGNYYVSLQAGSHTFGKSLKIETVRPNRLKIHIDTKTEEILGADKQSIDLYSEWLHGASAAGLKANVTLVLSPKNTSFEKFPSYTFQDEGKYYEATENVIFDGKLDESGKASILLNNSNIKSTGKLKASFVTKVFEKGGGFSIDNLVKTYHPYHSYVGLDLPLNKYGYLNTNKDHIINLVNLDTKGNLVKKEKTLQVKVYRIEWRWWWQHNAEDIASYISNNSYDVVENKTITTQGGKGTYKLNIDEYD
ncbi:MAG: MG2 domain-containing protein, partial [Bacteroidia bacterium]